MILGPNVKRLIMQKMSTDAIPAGGGIMDGVKFLSNRDTIRAGLQAATEWVELALRAVRQAAEPNPWKTSDDEVIAGELLRQIEEREKLRHGRRAP